MLIEIDTKGNEHGLLALVALVQKHDMDMSWVPQEQHIKQETPREAPRDKPYTAPEGTSALDGYPKPDSKGRCSARIAIMHAIHTAGRPVAIGDLMDGDTYELETHGFKYQALRQAFHRASVKDKHMVEDELGEVTFTDLGKEMYAWFIAKYPHVVLPKILNLRERAA